MNSLESLDPKCYICGDIAVALIINPLKSDSTKLLPVCKAIKKRYPHSCSPLTNLPKMELQSQSTVGNTSKPTPENGINEQLVDVMFGPGIIREMEPPKSNPTETWEHPEFWLGSIFGFCFAFIIFGFAFTFL